MTKYNLPANKQEWFFESYIQGSVFEFGPLDVDENETANIHNIEKISTILTHAFFDKIFSLMSCKWLTPVWTPS